jgi:hypothetical protein
MLGMVLVIVQPSLVAVMLLVCGEIRQEQFIPVLGKGESRYPFPRGGIHPGTA